MTFLAAIAIALPVSVGVARVIEWLDYSDGLIEELDLRMWRSCP